MITRASRTRLLLITSLVLIFEVLCRVGIISHFDAIPPSQIIIDLYRILVSGDMDGAIVATLRRILLAFTAAMAVGVVVGILLHRLSILRKTLEPLFAAYYSIPIFAFYPLFIVIFGLSEVPQIITGFLAGVVAVIANVLNGLDRVPPVLRESAKVFQMGAFDTALRVTLPCTMPYVLTGAKLAVSYAFTGVIGSEFIMSESGLGFEISNAYNIFDNSVMYPLVFLVLAVALSVNIVFDHQERRLRDRRGGRS